ncbi:MAG TPA: alkaline phosphatase PhoX [Gaiellaceae bacterium]|nr:alkaline phosphatase PhoX [Gaiellaceae bacterium]
MRRRKLAVLLAAMVAVGGAATGATTSGAQNQFGNTQDPMITVLDPAKPTVAILTTGDVMPGGYEFGSIPDGIAFRARGQGRVDVLVNHETSTVPFPFNAPFGGSPVPPAVNEANQNDFENSQVSQLVLNQDTGALLSAKYLISSNENFHRFCSSYLATAKEGFERPIYFANEEAQDWVNRRGTSWPGPTFIAPGTEGAEQTGVVVALDVQNGKRNVIYGMGRHNHENDVAVPGYQDDEGLVVLSGDDTFFTTPLVAPYKTAWSQLYSYIAPDTDALWSDEGDLWAFVSDDPDYDDYYDFAPGDTTAVSGHFIKVPKEVARGKKADGSELLSTNAGYIGMQQPPSHPAVIGPPPDGPQWVLDQWGNADMNSQDNVAPMSGENVFRFVRLEDIAYDKRPGMENVIYMADSGRAARPSVPVPPLANALSTNGRIWKMVLNKDDPTIVDSLSILIEGEDHLTARDDLVGAFHEIHQPDNIDTTTNGSLLVQEDPSSNNQYALPRGLNETPARLWRIDLAAVNPDADGARVTAAEVNQALDETVGYDVDGPQTDPPTIQPANLGNWESSGVIDVSSVFGPGAYLVTIQAHSLWIEKKDGPDAITTPAPANTGKDFTFKREGGQLALIYLDPDW